MPLMSARNQGHRVSEPPVPQADPLQESSRLEKRLRNILDDLVDTLQMYLRQIMSATEQDAHHIQDV